MGSTERGPRASRPLQRGVREGKARVRLLLDVSHYGRTSATLSALVFAPGVTPYAAAPGVTPDEFSLLYPRDACGVTAPPPTSGLGGTIRRRVRGRRRETPRQTRAARSRGSTTATRCWAKCGVFESARPRHHRKRRGMNGCFGILENARIGTIYICSVDRGARHSVVAGRVGCRDVRARHPVKGSRGRTGVRFFGLAGVFVTGGGGEYPRLEMAVPLQCRSRGRDGRVTRRAVLWHELACEYRH